MTAKERDDLVAGASAHCHATEQFVAEARALPVRKREEIHWVQARVPAVIEGGRWLTRKGGRPLSAERVRILRREFEYFSHPSPLPPPPPEDEEPRAPKP